MPQFPHLINFTGLLARAKHLAERTIGVSFCFHSVNCQGNLKQKSHIIGPHTWEIHYPPHPQHHSLCRGDKCKNVAVMWCEIANIHSLLKHLNQTVFLSGLKLERRSNLPLMAFTRARFHLWSPSPGRLLYALELLSVFPKQGFKSVFPYLQLFTPCSS